jgi:hypothetical protein
MNTKEANTWRWCLLSVLFCSSHILLSLALLLLAIDGIKVQCAGCRRRGPVEVWGEV